MHQHNTTMYAHIDNPYLSTGQIYYSLADIDEKKWNAWRPAKTIIDQSRGVQELPVFQYHDNSLDGLLLKDTGYSLVLIVHPRRLLTCLIVHNEEAIPIIFSG